MQHSGVPVDVWRYQVLAYSGSYLTVVMNGGLPLSISYWNGQNLCVHQLLQLYLRVAVSRLGTGISARRRYQRG